MTLANGQQLDGGRYTVEEQLGQGRFCITYLVKDRNDERFVIKTLNYDLPGLQTQSQVERDRLESKFLDEAVKLRGCSHPHIVKVERIFQQDGKSYMVMEYLAGYSLAKRPQKIMVEEDALRYIQQIADALSYVHGQGVIHRDVKPGNIMICDRSGNSEAILIDFGLALDINHDLTTARTQEASEGYAPIELYSSTGQKDNISPATDVYSLAATLYNLLTGIKPASAVKLKIDNLSIVAPQDFNSQISDRTNEAILSGLKLEPENRPESIQVWLDSLKSSDLLEDNPTPPTPNPVPEENPEKINWAVVWAAVAAIGALLAGIGELSGFIDLFKSETNSDTNNSETSAPKTIDSAQ